MFFRNCNTMLEGLSSGLGRWETPEDRAADRHRDVYEEGETLQSMTVIILRAADGSGLQG